MQPTLIINPLDEFKALVNQMASKGGSEAVRNLKSDLDAGTVKLVPYTIYSRILIGGMSTADFFDQTQGKNRTLGITNLDNARLEKGRFFMCLSVQIRAKTTVGITEADLAKQVYGSISAIPAIVNGEITLRTQNFPILQGLATANFDTTNNANVRQGEFYLATKRLIESQEDITGQLKAPVGSNFPADTALEILIHGVATYSLKSV